MRERLGKPVQAIIDINPAKHGKYAAVTGIQIQSPETALPMLPEDTTIFIMNSNYSNEIKEMSGNAYKYITIDDG